MIIKLDSRIAPTQWGIWDNGRFYFWSWATFHKNAIVSGGWRGKEKKDMYIIWLCLWGHSRIHAGYCGVTERPIGRLFLSFSCIFNSFEHRDTERGYTSGDNIHNNVNYSRACTGPAAMHYITAIPLWTIPININYPNFACIHSCTPAEISLNFMLGFKRVYFALSINKDSYLSTTKPKFVHLWTTESVWDLFLKFPLIS